MTRKSGNRFSEKIMLNQKVQTTMGDLSRKQTGVPAPAVMGFIVKWTGSFDAAFGFLIMMTAMAVVVAATINTAQQRLVPKPA